MALAASGFTVQVVCQAQVLIWSPRSPTCKGRHCRYEKVEQQKQGLKKAAELERRFAKKDGAAPDGSATDGAAASSDSDSDQDDEDKITETEEAGKLKDKSQPPESAKLQVQGCVVACKASIWLSCTWCTI